MTLLVYEKGRVNRTSHILLALMKIESFAVISFTWCEQKNLINIEHYVTNFINLREKV